MKQVLLAGPAKASRSRRSNFQSIFRLFVSTRRRIQ
jgi:hypothetical protein